MAHQYRMPLRPARKLAAIVVPLSNREELTPDEQISLRHLVHFLGKYDKYVVAPRHLKVNYSGFVVKRFHNRFFGSTEAYRNLMFSPRFYKVFSDYKYILVYQLDCLVFSDELIQWCETDLDYIGAPWIKHEDAPYVGLPQFEGRVGNSGFSLRKVESFLKIIYSSHYHTHPSRYWEEKYASERILIRLLNRPKKYFKYLGIRNNVRWELSKFAGNDDDFFANRGKHYYPDFKVASVETALRFSFECVPRYCFELNNYSLPFGCHAWPRYDREFWEPYLLK